jgi:hypothetical protein
LSELPKEIKKKKRKGKRKTEKLKGCVFLCVKQNASTLDMLVGLIKIMGRSLKEELNSSRCRVFF